MSVGQWEQATFGQHEYSLLNLSHPEVDARVMADMEAGVEVYYDRRWETAAVLSDWLEAHPEIYGNRKILVLGAGVGSETLVLGRQGSHLWLNDLSPVALELCARQMKENALRNFTLLEGRYETLDLPLVDLVVGSFLVYNMETMAAMESFIAKGQNDFLLVNERLDPFPKLLKKYPHEILFEEESAVGVLFRL